MTDYSAFAFGGTQYPLTASTANSLLQDADPSLYYAIDYFTSVLNTYLGARFTAVTALSPALPFSTVVAQTVPYDARPYLQEQQFKFPLLAVYRVDEDIDDRTTTWAHRSCRWDVQYILPPVTSAQMERIGPILKNVGDVLVNRIQNKFDPSYQSGLLVWLTANLESIGLMAGSYGRYEAGGNLAFPMYTGKLLVKERVMFPTVDPFVRFNGVDVTENIEVPEHGTVTNVTQVATQPAPTITLCTPNSGTVAGGTNVTLTGTGFVNGATVTIGGVSCTNVVVVSATSITCTTGASLALGSSFQVTVVVTNSFDGQSGKLPLGFTYT